MAVRIRSPAYFSLSFTYLMFTLSNTILLIVIFLFSAIIHEIAHGAMANYLGDSTAKERGRLTLNPLKHLDPIGSVLVPMFLIVFQSGIIFGWAKPVPINPLNLRDKKYGDAKVAAAGPLANISLAVLFGLLIRFVPWSNFSFGAGMITAFGFIVWINLLLAVFNLMPIPPLDGSHILFSVLPRKADDIKIFLSQYGMIILLFFIFFLLPVILPIIQFLFRLITGARFF